MQTTSAPEVARLHLSLACTAAAAAATSPRALRRQLRLLLSPLAPLCDIRDVSTGDTPLVAAVRGSLGYSRPIRRALIAALVTDAGVDPRETAADGTSPWDAALDLSVVGVLDALVVCAGYGVNEPSRSGKLPLHVVLDAGSYHHSEITPSQQVEQPLSMQLGQVTTCCVDSGHNEDMEVDPQLAERARTRALDALLALGADVNAIDSSGCTPLDVAMRTGNMQDFCLLLDHGADQNFVDHNGATPLHLVAAKLQHLYVAVATAHSLTSSNMSRSPLSLPFRLASREETSVSCFSWNSRNQSRTGTVTKSSSTSSSVCSKGEDSSEIDCSPVSKSPSSDSLDIPVYPQLSSVSVPVTSFTNAPLTDSAVAANAMKAIAAEQEQLLGCLDALAQRGVPVNARNRDNRTALDIILDLGVSRTSSSVESRHTARDSHRVHSVLLALQAACVLLRAGAVDSSEESVALAASLRNRDGRKSALEQVIAARSARSNRYDVPRPSLDDRASSRIVLPQLGIAARRIVRRQARAEQKNAASKAKTLSRSSSAPSAVFRDNGARLIMKMAYVQEYCPVAKVVQ